MGKKNKKMAPFFVFMIEFRNRPGQPKMTDERARTEAGKVWETMTLFEREPYINASGKKGQQNVKKTKYTTMHEDVDVVQRRIKEASDRQRCVLNELEGDISQMKLNGTLATTYFHIMHFYKFCKTSGPQGRYFPSEVALLRFTLKDGVKRDNCYTKIIYPGVPGTAAATLPLGSSLEAKNSTAEHGLPYLFRNGILCNMEEVMDSIFQFLEESAKINGGRFPIIYARHEEMQMVSEILHQLCDDYGYDPIDFNVQSISDLLYQIQRNVAGDKRWPSIFNATTFINKDAYCYTEHISCPYHTDHDEPQKCSLSNVIRLAFMICNNCCHHMRLPLVPGCHVPMNTVIPESSRQATGENSSSLAVQGRSYRNYSTAPSIDLQSDTDAEGFEKVVNKRGKGKSSSTSSSTRSLNLNQTNDSAWNYSQEASTSQNYYERVERHNEAIGPRVTRSPGFGRGRGRGGQNQYGSASGRGGGNY